jgi:hypothetical protein
VRRTTAFVLVAILTMPMLAVRGGAEQIVEIRVRGHYYSAPATVIVNVAVRPDAANHKLLIEAESERFVRSSVIELEGEGDKRIHTIQFKSLPEGEYVLRAEVRSRTDVRGQAVQMLTVTGVEGR